MINRIINVEVSTICYAKCAMCPNDQIKDKGYMSLELAKIIANKINNLPNVREISIAGRGEPTLHPKLIDFFKIFSGIRPLSLVTTGTHINDEIIEGCQKYVDILRLSISSVSKESFLKVHTNLNYEKVWGNIKELIKRLDRDKIVIHLIGGEVIYPTVKETVSFFRSRGVNNIKIFPLWNRGGTMEQNSERKIREKLIEELNIGSLEEDYWPEKIVRKCGSNNRYCPIGDSSLSINFKGEVVGCFQDFLYKTKIGNVMTDDLLALIKKRQRILGNMFICGECNSYSEIIN